jgi:hypothetical protein
MNRKTLLSYLIEAAVFIIIIAFGWNYYNERLETTTQNLIAYKGQLEEVELQNKNLLVSKDSYIATINDLEEQLDITKKEAREIQRQLNSKIAYIAKIEQSVKVEYVEVIKDSIVYVNNQHAIAKFHYNDDWMRFDGENEFQFGDNFDYITRVKNISITAPLTIGLTNDYQVFVTTPNPYITFTDIEGSVIENSVLKPRKKRFSWGVQFGFGTMYDIIDKNLSIGPYGGLGVEVNF